MTTRKFNYVPCSEADIPEGIRFDTPRSNQGQMVEVSYGTFGRAEAGPGDPYERDIDHADGTVEYFRLVQ